MTSGGGEAKRSRSFVILRALAVVAFVAGLLVFVAGFATEYFGEDEPAQASDDFTPIPLPSSTPTTRATATRSPSATPSPTPYNGAVARLKIPRFEVDSAIENIGLLPTGYLDTPHEPLNTGWYDIYDKPGFGGNAVFAAHVDYYPNILGPFHKLSQLEAGDVILITMDDGREYRYEVISKNRYRESEIPMGAIIDANEKPEGDEWITLITCGGEFRATQPNGAGEYLHRDVVVARRVA